MDCSWEKWSLKCSDWLAGFDGSDGFDVSSGCDGSDGFYGFDGFVGLVASSRVDRSDKELGAACFVDLDGSTKEHKEN